MSILLRGKFAHEPLSLLCLWADRLKSEVPNEQCSEPPRTCTHSGRNDRSLGEGQLERCCKFCKKEAHCQSIARTAGQPPKLMSRENSVRSISQRMIFSFPRFGWGKEVFGSFWIPLRLRIFGCHPVFLAAALTEISKF